MARFLLETNCVSANGDDINEMCDSSREITLKTFQRHVEWRDWAESMGYDWKSFPLRRDYHVRYFRSKYQGRTCYFAIHSAIEYVFTAAR